MRVAQALQVVRAARDLPAVLVEPDLPAVPAVLDLPAVLVAPDLPAVPAVLDLPAVLVARDPRAVQAVQVRRDHRVAQEIPGPLERQDLELCSAR